MLLDRHEQPIHLCTDPRCRWAHLSDADHFDRHNPVCGELFVTTDGDELLCELARGHEGPHRGALRRD